MMTKSPKNQISFKEKKKKNKDKKLEIKINRVKNKKNKKKERGTNKLTDNLNLADVIDLLILLTCSHGLCTKHTRRNILSFMQNHMIKDEFALYIEILALDTTKLKWIWTKLYKNRNLFCWPKRRRNCFKQTRGSDFWDQIKPNDYET